MTHPSTRGVSPWTPATKCRLSALWMQTEPKLSTAEIGRVMGVGKNAIVGMAHRMNLPPRQSPIIRVYARRQVGVTPAQSRVLVRLLPESVPTAVAPVKRAYFGTSPCQWPMGHPKEVGFRLCGDRAEGGKPYCGAHCSVAYLRRVCLEEVA